MIKFMLNKQKFNNYAFFCPVSRLHLTVSSPVGFASEVTPAILKGLKSKSVIDVDGVVDLETGTIKKAESKAPMEDDNKETETPKEGQETKATKSTNKRGKRAEANPVDEAAKIE